MKNIKINRKLITRIVSGGLGLVLFTTGFIAGKLSSKNNNSYKSNTTSIINDHKDLVPIDTDKRIENYLENCFEEANKQKKQLPNLSIEEVITPPVEEVIIQQHTTFNIENLFILENTNENNEVKFYILNTHNENGSFYEYHDYYEKEASDSHIINVPKGINIYSTYEYCIDFEECWNLYLDIDYDEYHLWPGLDYCNNCQPLFNYLTNSEIQTITNDNGQISKINLEKILNRIRTEYKQNLSKNNHSRSLINN